MNLHLYTSEAKNVDVYFIVLNTQRYKKGLPTTDMPSLNTSTFDPVFKISPDTSCPKGQLLIKGVSSWWYIYKNK